MPNLMHGLKSSDIHTTIKLLIKNLVELKDTTGKYLMELPDGRTIDTKGWNDWEWTHGIGLYGLYQHLILTGSSSSLDIIKSWFENRFAAGGTTKNINTMAALLTLAYLYEESGEKTYLPWLNAWAEWAMHELPRTRDGGMQHITYDSENKEELWVDTLMMTVLPLAKIGKLLGRPHYVHEAKRQFLVHIKYLFDTKTGLFFHGWKFVDDGEVQGHNFANARWARGNSWLNIAIPEFLELLEDEMDGDDPVRVNLIDTLEAQARALKKLQMPNGMWRTLLDISEEKGSYVEASSTAGFAFGILKAVRKRYIGKEYEEMGIRAVKAVQENVSEDGELFNVSFGTAMGDDLQHYKDIERTSTPYGQAMAIMALVEYLRAYI